jgi:hypothetical protein
MKPYLTTEAAPERAVRIPVRRPATRDLTAFDAPFVVVPVLSDRERARHDRLVRQAAAAQDGRA